ncbi:MAG TPA: hypothetical protein VJY62_12180 [Bacteroidia bacterium]|nr:hypothetical protein [Bacteroidia bacterium]
MLRLNILNRKWILTFLLLIAISTFSFSQNSKSSKDYTKHPYWIEMMDDSTVNYFEAVKAYDEFWANRKKPREEDEIIGEKRKKSLWDRIFSTREEKQEAEANKYKFLCKKFEHWKFVVQPYVQPDGRILSTDEQLELWKKQRTGN